MIVSKGGCSMYGGCISVVIQEFSKCNDSVKYILAVLFIFIFIFKIQIGPDFGSERQAGL